MRKVSIKKLQSNLSKELESLPFTITRAGKKVKIVICTQADFDSKMVFKSDPKPKKPLLKRIGSGIKLRRK